jgi:hypothetical protein
MGFEYSLSSQEAGLDAEPVELGLHPLSLFTCDQKPQEALNLLVTEERYWAPFYMPLYTCFYTICWVY